MSYIQEKDLSKLDEIRNEDLLRIVSKEGQSRLFEVGKYTSSITEGFALKEDIPTRISQLDDGDLEELYSIKFIAHSFTDINNKGMYLEDQDIIFKDKDNILGSFQNNGLRLDNIYFGNTPNNRHVTIDTGRSGSVTIKSVSGELMLGFIDPHKVPKLMFPNGAMEISTDRTLPITMRRNLDISGGIDMGNFRIVNTSKGFSIKSKLTDTNILLWEGDGSEFEGTLLDGAIYSSWGSGNVIFKYPIHVYKPARFDENVDIYSSLAVQDISVFSGQATFSEGAVFDYGFRSNGRSTIQEIFLTKRLLFKNNITPFDIEISGGNNEYNVNRVSGNSKYNYMKFFDDPSDPYSQGIDILDGCLKIIREGSIMVKDNIYAGKSLFLGDKMFQMEVDTNGTLILKGNVKVTGKLN